MSADETTGEIETMQVAADLIRQIAEDCRNNRLSLAEQAMSISSLKSSAEKTATASIEMATIAKERMEMERESRQAAMQAAQAQAESDREARQMLVKWFNANWRYLLIVGILIFYPNIISQMQYLGLLPAFGPPQVAVAQPVPAPQPAPTMPPVPPTSEQP